MLAHNQLLLHIAPRQEVVVLVAVVLPPAVAEVVVDLVVAEVVAVVAVAEAVVPWRPLMSPNSST